MTSNASAELFSITASTPTDGRRHGAAETSAITDVRQLASNLDQVLTDRHTASNP